MVRTSNPTVQTTLLPTFVLTQIMPGHLVYNLEWFIDVLMVERINSIKVRRKQA